MRLPQYFEALKAVHRFKLFDVYSGYPCSGRAFGAPLNKLFYIRRFAGSVYFYGKIRQVLYPSLYTEIIGCLPGACPEPDPLNAAGYDEMNVSLIVHTKGLGEIMPDGSTCKFFFDRQIKRKDYQNNAAVDDEIGQVKQ